MSEATTNTLLLNLLEQMGDLREQVGGINKQLDAGAATHKRLEENIQMIDRRTDITEDNVISINAALNPDNEPSLMSRVKELEIFKSKIGASVLVAGTIVGGALSLIYAGVWWVLSNFGAIKETVKSFFR